MLALPVGLTATVPINPPLILSSLISMLPPIVDDDVFASKDPAPLLTCGSATSSTIHFSIAGNNSEISIDSGKTWLTPNGSGIHTVTSLNPNQQIVASFHQAPWFYFQLLWSFLPLQLTLIPIAY